MRAPKSIPCPSAAGMSANQALHTKALKEAADTEQSSTGDVLERAQPSRGGLTQPGGHSAAPPRACVVCKRGIWVRLFPSRERGENRELFYDSIMPYLCSQIVRAACGEQEEVEKGRSNLLSAEGRGLRTSNRLPHPVSSSEMTTTLPDE